MAKVLVRALVLVGLGIAIGCVHSQIGDRPVTGLSQQPSQSSKPQPSQPLAEKPAPVQPPGGTATVKGDPKPGGDGQSDHPGTPGKEPGTPVTGSNSGPAVAPPPTQPSAPANPAEKYFISLAKAKELFDLKAKGQWDGVFIDARGYDNYLEGHIPGSMHIDKKYFDGKRPEKVRMYLPGVEVVIYCHGEQCTDSEAVAVRLQALKLNIGPIHIIKEGFPGWAAAGFPVDKGGEVGFDEK